MGFLQVLLLILKILGILFASVIVLLLVSLLLVLFVPVRYRAQGHKAEDYGIDARISWLLHIFRVRIRYAKEEKLSYEVYFLWFLFLSSDEAWKAVHEEKKKRKEEKKKKRQKEKRARKKAKKKKKTSGTVVQKQVVTTEKPRVEAKPDSTAEMTLPEEKTSEETRQQDGVEAEKKHWFVRIRDKIRELLQKLKQKLKAILDMLRKLWQKADTIITFLKETVISDRQ